MAVPLGTYTGWNLRPPAMGAPDHLARWSGSYFPFPATEEERRRTGDPRPSLEARGFLLPEDARALVSAARGLPWPPP